jgi:hypothetical protein
VSMLVWHVIWRLSEYRLEREKSKEAGSISSSCQFRRTAGVVSILVGVAGQQRPSVERLPQTETMGRVAQGVL